MYFYFQGRLFKSQNLADALSEHCFCNFFKSGCVGTDYIVALVAVFLSCIYHVVADVNHDAL